MKKRQAFLSILAMSIVMLASGFSVFAAGSLVQVSAHLSENTVSVSGTVQNSEVSEIGVLILRKEADFEQLDSDDIVYANQYELDEKGEFSFGTKLPSADLKEYVLQIGGTGGVLYRKLLDGSELPESSSSSSGSQEESSSPSTSSDSGSESGSEAEGQQSSGNSSEGSIASSTNSSKETGSGNTVNTGEPQNWAVWGFFLLSASMAIMGIIVVKKKGESQHE